MRDRISGRAGEETIDSRPRPRCIYQSSRFTSTLGKALGERLFNFDIVCTEVEPPGSLPSGSLPGTSTTRDRCPKPDAWRGVQYCSVLECGRKLESRRSRRYTAMAFVGRYDIRFATMSDGELCRVTSNSSDSLNESARHALARELWRRGLRVELPNDKFPPRRTAKAWHIVVGILGLLILALAALTIIGSALNHH